MRRLVLELPLEDFIRLKGGGEEFYRTVASFTVVQILRVTPRAATSIVRVRPADPRVRFESLARRSHVNLQLLDRDGDAYVCLMTVRPSSAIYRKLGFQRDPGFLIPPMEVEGGTARITFAGSSVGVARFTAAMRRMGLRPRILTISDYRLAPDSPLNVLTEKQRRVVSAAYRQGYYDRPRRISSKLLAQRLGVSSSTLVNHRLKAEHRLLATILESASAPPGGAA